VTWWPAAWRSCKARLLSTPPLKRAATRRGVGVVEEEEGWQPARSSGWLGQDSTGGQTIASFAREVGDFSCC